MATAKKTDKHSTAAKTAPVAPAKKAHTPVMAQPEPSEATPRTRGPRGVPETAVITLLVDSNPKREGSKAHAIFSHYESGQTIADFCAALEATDPEMVKEATPHIVYDVKHGFIEIEGYTPPGGVIAKEVRPKAEKPAKASKGKRTAEQAAVEYEAAEEVMD